MKKFLCMVLAVLMLVMSVAAVAEAPKFDKSKLTGSPLYSYDKFTKKWNVQGTYVKEYSDVRIEVCFLLFDTYVTEEWGPELRVIVFDKESQSYCDVIAFRAIVGEQMFCWENMRDGTNCGYVFGGEVAGEFAKALQSSEEVAFQVVYTDKYGNTWRYTIDPVDSAALGDLREVSKLLNDSNAWTIDPLPAASDNYYGATME